MHICIIEFVVLFAGCLATSDDVIEMRLVVFKHIIDLFQTLNLSTEVITELTGVLLNEVWYFVSELYLSN